MKSLEQHLNQRILVLDGATGTLFQSYGLSEQDFRGTLFRRHPVDLQGNYDVLSLTQPEVVENMHRSYLEAGADLIETNTFTASRISQSEFGLEEFTWKMNYEATRIARAVADQYTVLTPEKPRWVCGSLGPTNRSASISPDADDPTLRVAGFDELAAGYFEQAEALLAGGADVLLVETVFDTLNGKAALYGIQELFRRTGKRIPVMVSGTVVDASGRNLSGQTVEAFWISVRHAPLLSVGLNCSLGAGQLRPWLEDLARVSNIYISVHPNAGLPDELGEYRETPEAMAAAMRGFAVSGLVNIVGGCCGTTPSHIAAIVAAVENLPPRSLVRD